MEAGIDDPKLFDRLLDSGGFLFTEQVESLMAANGIVTQEAEEGAQENDGSEVETPEEEPPSPEE